jgi:hypothetical protein
MKLLSKLPWTASIDGADLVVRNVMATCFGGKYDKGDDGRTESGVLNDGSNDIPQCALPIRSTEAATRDSPLAFKGPHIPWGTKVRVWLEVNGEHPETDLVCELTDNGPDISQFPTHALDLNPPAALHFSPCADPKTLANSWSMHGMSYRILGGAKWVS